MFRPFQYSNSNRRRMQNNNKRPNKYAAANKNIMYPNESEENTQKSIDSKSVFNETLSLPNIIPVVNGESTDLTDPTIAEFLRLNPKLGYLKMRVTTARGALPIYNANVTIYKAGEDKQYLIASETTDLDGLTIPVPLPAPDKTQSFNPENPRPYADYDLVVTHPEYKTVELNNIPVFDDITSIQNVNMVAFKEPNPPTVINEGTTQPKE